LRSPTSSPSAGSPPPKDYPTLLHAFSAATNHKAYRTSGDCRRRRAARLTDETLAMIWASTSSSTSSAIAPTPSPTSKSAQFFVLSSHLGRIRPRPARALALGTPSIATDCPSGPAEILGHGEFGMVVKVGDVAGPHRGDAQDVSIIATAQPVFKKVDPARPPAQPRKNGPRLSRIFFSARSIHEPSGPTSTRHPPGLFPHRPHRARRLPDLARFARAFVPEKDRIGAFQTPEGLAFSISIFAPIRRRHGRRALRAGHRAPHPSPAQTRRLVRSMSARISATSPSSPPMDRTGWEGPCLRTDPINRQRLEDHLKQNKPERSRPHSSHRRLIGSRRG